MQCIKQNHPIANDSYFLFSSALILLILQSLLRVVLYWRNADLAVGIPSTDILNAFLTGIRFDLIITVYAMVPLILGFLLKNGLRNRKICIACLTIVSLVIVFLAVLELDFYHEFHARLNSMVFEYMQEDPATVISMIWHGFPVVKYLAAIFLLTAILYYTFSFVSRMTPHHNSDNPSYVVRLSLFILIMLMSAVAARGTLRQGPPLRWGDAFHSQHLFANHLGLNGTYTLTKAIMASDKSKKHWLKKMPLDQAILDTASMLHNDKDTLLASDISPVYRKYAASQGLSDKPLNVVFILMESFSAEFVGAMDHDDGITPNFDKLSKQGLLFDHFLSNGTHTHQGMFASLACFPNLPNFEYLMQQPEGNTAFSGMIKMTADRGYQSMYIYNGDFAWDNQKGFFGTQGMQRFIGRHDFINPVFSDPTWGVSDQDMFDRAAEELAAQPSDKPFFAFLQTLSNHTPYALPSPLPVAEVTGHGELNKHLTAMHYADWALGEFFKKVEKQPYFNNTIFILVGDHGFGTEKQITDIDLLRFHVPLLIIGPKVTEKYGTLNHTVGSQVDIAPTLAGLLGGETTHSCWGRDLLNTDDAGFAIIKPSGSDHTTAIVKGDKVLVKLEDSSQKLYQYTLGKAPHAEEIDTDKTILNHQLDAYIESATSNLLQRKVGLENTTPVN
ncbi:MAG TPA: DUF229 domain-containing protein [Methylophaga aminisulfidivorans]|uniref:DUF229 domain-containing protein n=1 Tax=Methylophaga aminisulfidivorans TaxID=230105 RepID=A0A7C1VYX3_9GAMM|nr:DUF229 domain-containing protein [Methylophaga aminisulfidivorans]